MAWKDGLCESGLYKFDAGEVNLGKIESGSRYAGNLQAAFEIAGAAGCF